MKKYAFSYWPNIFVQPPKEQLSPIRNESIKILESDGFLVECVDTFGKFDKWAALLIDAFKDQPTVKDYTNFSDYGRVVHLREKLDQYDEVLYFDYDLLILDSPKQYGVGLECHFSNDENKPDIKLTDKFWFRGVNCAIYLSKKHIPILDSHLEDMREVIEKTKGKVQHCYPMDLIWRLEEQVGYIPGYYLFGSLEEPGYCTEEKVLYSLALFEDFLGTEYAKIQAVNLMGSRQKLDFVTTANQYKILSDAPRNFTLDDIRDVIQKTTKPIRVNYGAAIIRRKMKEWVFSNPMFL